jgi:hypothetical protein
MKTSLLILIVSSASLITGCSETNTCQSSETQKLVKEMYRIQIDRLKEPLNPTRDLIQQQINEITKGQSEKAFNSIRVRSDRIQNIQLSKIETVEKPTNADASQESMCKATISMHWPAEIVEKMEKLAVLQSENTMGATLEQGVLSHPVLYKTRLDENGRHEILLQKLNPFLGIILRGLTEKSEDHGLE